MRLKHFFDSPSPYGYDQRQKLKPKNVQVPKQFKKYMINSDVQIIAKSI